MRIRLIVHSHDTALPEHDQVHFNTPDHKDGMVMVRLPKGAPLPDIGAEYTANFTSAAEEAHQEETRQAEHDHWYKKGKEHARAEAAAKPADRAADTLGETAPRFDDSHGAEGGQTDAPQGSDQGGA